MSPTFSLSQRSSGVLLHPTSLPSRHGIGDVGSDARKFIDFLHAAGQTWWQMFPLGPPGYGGSPYQPHSAFAGNPLLISLELLMKQGLLDLGDVVPLKIPNPSRLELDRVQAFKSARFQKAYWAFEGKAVLKREFKAFYERHHLWLEDYSLYCVLKELYKGASWVRWSPDLRSREAHTIQSAKRQLAAAMRYHQFLQYQFFKQWEMLKEYAHRRGVGLIGDIPIFVAHDSADVWANPDLFWLEKDGHPTFVAGTPPDYFSKDGQRWGNPLYRWDRLKKSGYQWWFDRLKILFGLVDAVRLDHFIGFERYWRIPGKDKVARHGRWIPGPSDHFFTQLRRKLGPLDIIAEDLGAITEEVSALRDRFRFPGMKILQFAFGDVNTENHFLPHNFQRNFVVYTGTHDNDTTVGWYNDKGGKSSTRTRAQIQKEKAFAREYMKSNGKEIHWDMIRLAQLSVANTAIIPAQDLLGLGPKARMNTPGTSGNNWVWRLRSGQLNKSIADRLRKLTLLSGRR